MVAVNDSAEVRIGASDARQQILRATERLLEEIPLAELNVARILAEAGVARTTFYVYFTSKYGPVAALLERVMDEIYQVMEAFTARPADERGSGQPVLEKSLVGAVELFRDHRMVLRATVEHWHEVPELRTLWLNVIERFTDAFAVEIDRERAAGHAPPGLPSRELAAALCWGSERCMYVAGLGVDADLPNEDEAMRALQAFWRGAVYGPGA
jgi:TetR/AcrR family transcriptional regulator, ethionamide resistance regulator